MTVGADAAVAIDGPWAHRSVSANGTRFHVAEAGDGPLVLLRDGASRVGQLLERWSAPGWPDAQTRALYARAMRIPSVAHSALEYHRWLARSGVRPDGLRYARHMRAAIQAPTLHLHGAVDGCVLPRTARGSGRYVDGAYRWRVLDGAGHYPHEERPDAFNLELAGWLTDPEPER